MSNSNIKDGSTVCLKSGGPKMTVASTTRSSFIGRRPEAECYWIDEHGRQHQGWFPVSTLTTK